MKEIINCVVSWNFLNRELFEPYGLNQEDRSPKAISFESQTNVKDLDILNPGQVDLIYFHERTSMTELESRVLSKIYKSADKVFTIIHEPILKTWEGMPLLNQLIEGKQYFPLIPTHSTHGPFIELMYKMGESFQQRNRVEYDSHLSNLRSLAGAQPAYNRQNARSNAALEIMNRTLRPAGPDQVVAMADNFQDLFIREQVNKPGVREVLEEMDRQYELEASVSSLRRKLHGLLFPMDQ